MLCVRVGWGAWTPWSSLSLILLFYPVYSTWAVKFPCSGFCFIDMGVVSSHWCVFPLEIFVSSWCPDGQPLRSVLSMYICIFVFATRFRARWHFSYSLDLVLWHLPWKGPGADVHSLSPWFHTRKKTSGSENEEVITESKHKQGLWNSCFLNEWWECSCDPNAVMPCRFKNARFSVNVNTFCGWNRMTRRAQTFFPYFL